MRNLGLLALRTTVGGYLAVHGAQKLFGSFGGYGIDGTARWYESIGLKPGKPLAIAAGVGELGGGLLTATGIASPLGPLAIAGVMSVASSTHLEKGPLNSNGGYELPVTNLAAALALALTGPGALRLGPHASKKTTVLATAAIAGGAAYTISKVLGARSARALPAATATPALTGNGDVTAVEPVAVEAIE